MQKFFLNFSLMNYWQEHYLRGETPWDKGRAHPQIKHLPDGLVAGRWLVPGCGFGHDARALLALGASEVVGVDIAPAAVAGANALWQDVPGLRVVQADFFSLPADLVANGFDGIWEHTCFCAIDPDLRAAYVSAAASALRPKGSLMACFYLNPWDPDEDQKQGPPFGVAREELDAYFQADFSLVSEFAPQDTFPGREGKEWMRWYRRL